MCLTIQYFASSQPFQPDGTIPSPLPDSCLIHGPEQRRRRLRLYLVGAETDTQATIDYLHQRGCIERIEWTRQAIALPENGVVIRPDPGDVLRYLQRERSFG